MAEPPVYEQHPEIHHYTDLGGLTGIIQNHTVWATRYDKLNDKSEVVHLRTKLVNAVAAAIEPVVADKFSRSSRHLRRTWQATAGGVAGITKSDSAGIVDVIYEVTFAGRKGSRPFAVPYITSFCSHSTDDEYMQNHGLLSQWRAYGGRERYAVVFDTRELTAALTEEGEAFELVFAQIGDVVYNDEALNFSERYGDLVELFAASYRTYFRDAPDDDVMTKLYKEFVTSATRFKHRDFREEREVRIVAAPMTAELNSYLIEKTGANDIEGRQLKPIKSRMRNGDEIPYVALLEERGRPLPIKRIIVGPCADRADAAAKARELVRGSNIAVSVSESPYTG